MKRKTGLMILLSLITVGWGAGMAGVAGAIPPEEAKTSHKAQKLREKMLKIPPQTMVEVLLKNQEIVKGRLGDVSSDSFVVKEAVGQRIEDRNIAFNEVKSMKMLEGNKARTLREKVLEIPPQTMVEVRLKNKEVVKGRLGDISSDAFIVREAVGQRIEDRKIAFNEVKSMKKFEGNNALKVAGYSVLVVAAVLGTLFLITGILILVG